MVCQNQPVKILLIPAGMQPQVKTDIAVALFERDHKSIGNTDVSLPINNPAVFTNDGAEKSNVKLSSWDKLKAYSTGNK